MHDRPESFEGDEWHEGDGARNSHENRSPEEPSASSPAIASCPRCQSSRVETRNRARKTGGAIGTVAGATSAAAMALSGAEMGATVGLIAGPVGAVCGGIAGAIIAGLIGGAGGCVAGSIFGEVVDANVFDNYRCIACDYTFSRKQG